MNFLFLLFASFSVFAQTNNQISDCVKKQLDRDQGQCANIRSYDESVKIDMAKGRSIIIAMRMINKRDAILTDQEKLEMFLSTKDITTALLAGSLSSAKAMIQQIPPDGRKITQDNKNFILSLFD